MKDRTEQLKTENPGLIDWHCHLLPGLDDGAASMEESVKMARILAAAGFTAVCCTPHQIRGGYEKSAAEIRNRTSELQQKLDTESVPLELVAGAEYYLDENITAFLEDPLTLSERVILVEAPFHPNIACKDFEKLVDKIISSGFTPLIAHPERSPVFAQRRAKGDWSSIYASVLRKPVLPGAPPYSFVQILKGKGCRFQGNIGSFAGYYGERIKDQAKQFLESGLYDCFGSDAHRSEHLKELLRQGMQTIDLIKSVQHRGTEGTE